MRNRAALMLMEQLLMVLVFALAAAWCLQVYAQADRISEEIGGRDRAVILAQNAAETIKSCKGDMEDAARILGAVKEQESWTVCYDEEWNRLENTKGCCYLMEIQTSEVLVTGLGQAQIQIVSYDDSKEALFSIIVAWQEDV